MKMTNIKLTAVKKRHVPVHRSAEVLWGAFGNDGETKVMNNANPTTVVSDRVN